MGLYGYAEMEGKLEHYNVEWDSPSDDSTGSMPIGNGDLSANVWAEKDGTLSFYIGKTDTWSEATRLLKLGKVKVQISPNPFRDGMFHQILRIKEGEILIRAGKEGRRITLRVWVDANYPVIRLEADGEQEFDIKVSSEIWRTTPNKVREKRESLRMNNWNFFYSPVAEPSESADVAVEDEKGIVWYHRNETSPYREILSYQNAGEFFREEDDPYRHRTFGAYVRGDGLKKANQTTLKGLGGRQYTCFVYAHTAITESWEAWLEQMKAIVESDRTDLEIIRQEHRNWWKDFWNRSWIFASGDEMAEIVTRGYLMQRYMQAIQGRGAYPVTLT